MPLAAPFASPSDPRSRNFSMSCAELSTSHRKGHLSDPATCAALKGAARIYVPYLIKNPPERNASASDSDGWIGPASGQSGTGGFARGLNQCFLACGIVEIEAALSAVRVILGIQRERKRESAGARRNCVCYHDPAFTLCSFRPSRTRSRFRRGNCCGSRVREEPLSLLCMPALLWWFLGNGGTGQPVCRRESLDPICMAISGRLMMASTQRINRRNYPSRSNKKGIVAWRVSWNDVTISSGGSLFSQSARNLRVVAWHRWFGTVCSHVITGFGRESLGRFRVTRGFASFD